MTEEAREESRAMEAFEYECYLEQVALELYYDI